MDWQIFITIGLVSLAASYLLWRWVAAWRSTRAGSCSGGCGCVKTPKETATPTVIPAEQLTLRRPT